MIIGRQTCLKGLQAVILPSRDDDCIGSRSAFFDKDQHDGQGDGNSMLDRA